MPFFNFEGIRICGIASAVPSGIIQVDSFNDLFGEQNVSQFKEMTGVNSFHHTSKYQTASDLGFVAAETLINKKEIDRESIGALIFVSHSPDYRRPATSCVLQKRLKLRKECAVFDINLGCSAFVYGLVSLCSLIASSSISNGLLVVAETLSKMVYPKDRSAAMLFGDGGSAILLEKSESSKIQGLLRADGNNYKAIIAPAGGFRNLDADESPMIWGDGNERTLYNTNMNGTDVFNFTISDVPLSIKDFLIHFDHHIDNFDCFAFHQANKFIHKQLSKKLKIPLEKMPLSISKYGNTSAPSIPLTLCDSFGDKEGFSLSTLMCGFGVGLSWGVISALINVDEVFPVVTTDEYFEEGIINKPEDL